MFNRDTLTKYKNQFKILFFYSIPDSILFVVRKRLNLVFMFIFLVIGIIVTIF